MKVYANPGYTSMWCDGDAGKQFVSYNINAPLQFEGNNIKTVTYRINKGISLLQKQNTQIFQGGRIVQRKLSSKLPFLHRKRERNTGKTVYCKYNR